MMGELNYTGPIDLPQYYVEKYTIMDQYKSSDMSDDQFGVRVEIVLGRRLLNSLLTTFLPTGCICLVAFSSNFFRVWLNNSLNKFAKKQLICILSIWQASYFDVIVTVNVTLLLVLSTLFISVLDSMPRTSYVKMIDIWLIFCLLIPLAEVLFHAMLDNYRHEIEIEDAGVDMLSNVGPAPKMRVERKKKRLNRLQNLGMIGFPLMFIIFVFVYFFVGLA